MAEGKHYKFQGETKTWEFWAQGGRVYILNTDQADDPNQDLRKRVKTISPAELLQRAFAIAFSLQDMHADIRSKANKLLEEAEACAKAARYQGDVSDPKVRDQMSRSVRRRSIVMPGQVPTPAMAGIPSLSYKIKKEQADEIFENGGKLVPDLQIPPNVGMKNLQAHR